MLVNETLSSTEEVSLSWIPHVPLLSRIPHVPLNSLPFLLQIYKEV